MSSDGKVVVEYISQMGAVLRDQGELVRSLDRVVTKFDRMADAGKTAKQSLTEEQRAAARVTAEHMTGLERLQEKKKQLDRLFDPFGNMHISYETWKRGTAAVDAEMAKLGQTGRSTFDTFLTGTQRTALEIAGVATALGAVAKLAGVIKGDYEAWKRNLEQSAEFGKNWAEVKSNILLNAPPEVTGDQVDAIADDIVRRTGGRDKLEIGRGMATSFSVSSETTPEQVANFMVSASAITRDDRARNTIARGGAAFAHTQAIPDQPEAAIGFLLAGQAQSFVADAHEYMQSAAPAIGNARVNKLGERQVAALFGTLSRFGEDPTGQTARTSIIQLNEQATDLRRQLGLPDDADLSQVQNAMAKNKGALDRLLGSGRRPGTLTGEKRYIALLRDWFQGGETFKAYESALAEIPELGDESAAFYRMKVAQQVGDASIQAANVGQASEGSVQAFIADPNRVRQGTAVQAFDRAINSGTLPFGRKQMAQANFFLRTLFGQSPEEAAARGLEQEAWNIRYGVGTDKQSATMLEENARTIRAGGPRVYSEAERHIDEAEASLKAQTEREMLQSLKKIEENTARAAGRREANGPPPNLQQSRPAP